MRKLCEYFLVKSSMKYKVECITSVTIRHVVSRCGETSDSNIYFVLTATNKMNEDGHCRVFFLITSRICNTDYKSSNKYKFIEQTKQQPHINSVLTYIITKRNERFSIKSLMYVRYIIFIVFHFSQRNNAITHRIVQKLRIPASFCVQISLATG